MNSNRTDSEHSTLLSQLGLASHVVFNTWSEEILDFSRTVVETKGHRKWIVLTKANINGLQVTENLSQRNQVRERVLASGRRITFDMLQFVFVKSNGH